MRRPPHFLVPEILHFLRCARSTCSGDDGACPSCRISTTREPASAHSGRCACSRCRSMCCPGPAHPAFLHSTPVCNLFRGPGRIRVDGACRAADWGSDCGSCDEHTRFTPDNCTCRTVTLCFDYSHGWNDPRYYHPAHCPGSHIFHRNTHNRSHGDPDNPPHVADNPRGNSCPHPAPDKFCYKFLSGSARARSQGH